MAYKHHRMGGSLRLDRTLTLFVVAPLRRCRLRSPRYTLPILMYHSISDEVEEGIAPYYRTCTAAGAFARHMQVLKSAGYRGVTLAEGLSHLGGAPDSPAGARNGASVTKTQSAQKLAVITFDDGFRNFYTIAAPILREHGFSATMYLPTGYIAENPRSFKDRECLCWSDIRDLHRAGVEFGSHSVTHPRLVDLNWPQIETELRDSKAEIETQLGCRVMGFSYPYAFPQSRTSFVSRFLGLLEALNYESCVTTQIGCVRKGDNLLRLKRLPANGCDDTPLLLAKLDGSYDWLAPVQSTLKNLKTMAAGTRRVRS